MTGVVVACAVVALLLALGVVVALLLRLLRSRTEGVAAVARKADLAAVRLAVPPPDLAALMTRPKADAVQSIRAHTGLTLRQSVLLYDLTREGRL